MPAAGIPFGRYLLGERLATGGMGEVFLGVQLGPGKFEKPLALKLLLPHLSSDPAAVEMFFHEANLAALMHHPNVVQILDVGVEGGRHYIAMELVRGVALSQLLRSLVAAREFLPMSLVTFIAHGLLDGLHHAHELLDKDGRPLEIAHRDVSPQNLLLSVSGEVKLADFGIAKARETQGHTRTGTVKGKLEYLAPEQFDGIAASRVTDVFAAAITIYQAASLYSPFRRDTDAATMRAVMKDPLTPLSQHRTDAPLEFEQAILNATARVPGRRTKTAQALREAIPVLYGPRVRDELGALILKHCGSALVRLDAQTQEASRLASRVQPAGTAEVAISDDVPVPRRARWKVPVAVAAAVVGLGGAAIVALQRPAESVVIPTVPTPVTPQPVAALDSFPKLPHEGHLRPALPVLPEPRARQVAMVRAPVPLTQSGMGFLTIDAVPWAIVTIAGKRIGETPLYKFPVDPGEVVVLLENPETKKSVRKKLKVVSGKEQAVRENLQ